DETFTGDDSFTIRASDGFFTSNIATVTLSGHAPVAADDGIVETFADAPVVIAVLENDSDVDSTTIELSDVTDGQLGTVIGNWSDGTVTYSPNAGTSGLDQFTYTIQDSQGNTGQGTVTVRILPVSNLLVAAE